MRSYKAAKRAAKREPIPFEIEYVESVQKIGPDGMPVAGPDGRPVLVDVERCDQFVCRGEISGLTMSEFAYHSDISVASVEGAALLKQAFDEAFGDAREYRRFFEVARRHLEDDQLMEILGDLIEAFTARPTEQPSTSPSGQSTAGPDSRVVSLPGGFSTQATPVASSG